jgi:hypothetical protein
LPFGFSQRPTIIIMNQLISTQNGGIPLDWNDFRFEQAAVRDALFGLLSAFGITPAQSFILSGCTQPVMGSITAGYIAKGGEVYQVDAQAIPTPGSGQYVCFSPVITYDPSGMKRCTTAWLRKPTKYARQH